MITLDRIVAREVRSVGSLYIEAVLVRPPRVGKGQWRIYHLENSRQITSERFAHEPAARERWAVIAQSIAMQRGQQ